MHLLWKHFQTRVANVLSMKPLPWVTVMKSHLSYGQDARLNTSHESSNLKTNKKTSQLNHWGVQEWCTIFENSASLVVPTWFTFLFLRHTSVCQRGRVHTDRIQLPDLHIFSKCFSIFLQTPLWLCFLSQLFWLFSFLFFVCLFVGFWLFVLAFCFVFVFMYQRATVHSLKRSELINQQLGWRIE